MEPQAREQMIEQIQRTCRRHGAPELAPEVFAEKSDGQVLTWVRRLAVLEFERTRLLRIDEAHA